MIQAGVIGVGQTNYDSKRRDVSMAGLVREAIDQAMLAANIEWDAVDAVVLGKAPDMFEGVVMPELILQMQLGLSENQFLGCILLEVWVEALQ